MILFCLGFGSEEIAIPLYARGNKFIRLSIANLLCNSWDVFLMFQNKAVDVLAINKKENEE